MNKTITLSSEQWDNLLEALEAYNDCGPEGEGWKSEKLGSAESALEKAVDEAEETP